MTTIKVLLIVYSILSIISSVKTTDQEEISLMEDLCLKIPNFHQCQSIIDACRLANYPDSKLNKDVCNRLMEQAAPLKQAAEYDHQVFTYEKRIKNKLDFLCPLLKKGTDCQATFDDCSWKGSDSSEYVSDYHSFREAFTCIDEKFSVYRCLENQSGSSHISEYDMRSCQDTVLHCLNEGSSIAKCISSVYGPW